MRHVGIYPLVALLVVLAGAYLVFSQNVLSGNTFEKKAQGLDDIEKLEDLIIINGLEMSSSRPLDDDRLAGDGTIIYDDDFDIPSRNARTGAPVATGSIKKSPSGDELLADLKKQDRRWRLHRHRIKSGENLWGIAHRYGVSHALIIKFNGITDPDMLSTGKTISVPSRRDFSKPKHASATPANLARKDSDVRPSARTKKRPGTRIDSEIARSEHSVERGASAGESNAAVRPERITFQWPLRGKITSSFGRRIDPFTRKKAFHCGLDVSANVGTPIKASATGRVIFSGWKDGYGNVVIMKHDHGYITVYAHNNKNFVAEGDQVDAGKIIAEAGMTGAVTGAHLHFEIRKYLTPLNPMRFLK